MKGFFSKCCHLQTFVDVAARRLFVRLLKSLFALTLEPGPRHVALALLAADCRVGPARVHPLAPLGLLAVYPVSPSAFATVCQEISIERLAFEFLPLNNLEGPSV